METAGTLHIAWAVLFIVVCDLGNEGAGLANFTTWTLQCLSGGTNHPSLLGARTLLGAPGLTARSKKLLANFMFRKPRKRKNALSC